MLRLWIVASCALLLGEAASAQQVARFTYPGPIAAPGAFKAFACWEGGAACVRTLSMKSTQQIDPSGAQFVHVEAEIVATPPGALVWIEFAGSGWRTVAPNKGARVWACAHDRNGDGLVDFGDYQALAQDFAAGRAGGRDFGALVAVASKGERCA